jgi:hypothetical protein
MRSTPSSVANDQRSLAHSRVSGPQSMSARTSYLSRWTRLVPLKQSGLDSTRSALSVCGEHLGRVTSASMEDPDLSHDFPPRTAVVC